MNGKPINFIHLNLSGCGFLANSYEIIFLNKDINKEISGRP